MDILKDAAAYVVGGLVAIIFWFLRQKDDQQAKQISALWQKHDEDAKALVELRERIAREHYVKAELDTRFQRLEDAVHEGFRTIGDQLRVLSDSLLRHMAKEEKDK